MKLNNSKNINRIIYLLDTHIIELFSKKQIDIKSINALSQIRFDYMKELNSLISSKNTKEMFNKEYWKRYRKSNHRF